MKPHFCPNCGAQLEIREVGGRQRPVCTRCGRIHYEHLKVGAGALIEQDGRLLLLERTHEPFKGCWNLPAGYVEADESPIQAALREACEETGLRVEVIALDDVYFFDDDPRGNGILIVYRCRVLGGELSASNEGINPMYWSRDQIPARLAGGGHDQAIRAWQKKVN